MKNGNQPSITTTLNSINASHQSSCRLLRPIILLVLLSFMAGCTGFGKSNGLLPWAKKDKQEFLDRAILSQELAKGENLENTGKLDKARKIYTKLSKQFPQKAEPYHRLAIVADRQRRHTEAQLLYTQALRIDPRNAELFNDLGYCFYLQGKLKKAKSSIYKAVALDESNARFRNNLGLVQGGLGNYDEAFAQFSKAGSQADAYYNLAFVLSSKNHINDAKQCFQKALIEDPNHKLTKQALRSFEQFDEESGIAGRDDLFLEDSYYTNHKETASTGGDFRIASLKEVGSLDSLSFQGGVNTVSHTRNLPNHSGATKETRALHSQARSLFNRRMSSQRGMFQQ